jgi:hypothetical protein
VFDKIGSQIVLTTNITKVTVVWLSGAGGERLDFLTPGVKQPSLVFRVKQLLYLPYF